MISEISRTKGVLAVIIFGYLTVTFSVYLSVPSNLMDASNHLICHMMCPVYAAALSRSF
jgi:hypothetical protein